MEKLVVIDGNSIINRAFYGLPDLTTTDGRHTNAVLGFLNILFKLAAEEQPDYLAVAFDVPHPTFRHEMYPEYKGTRKGMPEELREQVPLLKQMLAAMEVLTIECPGFEADDILGALSVKGTKDGKRVTLVSGDRDLLQLCTDEVLVRVPKTKRTGTEIEDYTPQKVMEVFGVTPSQIVDLKGLMGDSSDNIPGVPGVGEKTAVKILTKYPDVEEAIAHAEELEPKKAREALLQNAELARLCKALATIKTDWEPEFSYEAARFGNLFTDAAYDLCKKLEFKSLLAKYFTAGRAGGEAKKGFPEAPEQIGSPGDVKKLLVSIQKGEYIGFSAAGEELLIAKEGKGYCIEKDVLEQYGRDVAAGGEELPAVRSHAAAGAGKEQGKKGTMAGQSAWETGISCILHEICRAGAYPCAFDLKRFAGYTVRAEAGCYLDAALAAYVLNPLKNSYTYEDIARDYLSLTLPAPAELLAGREPVQLSLFQTDLSEETGAGKTEETDAGKTGERTAAYLEAMTAHAAAKTMLDRLEADGELSLYQKIELPLVFTLYEMEKMGMEVNPAYLAEYSKMLNAGIEELTAKIYQMAGEEFNINSPKQLGVILFEKLKLPYGKKTKTGYSTSADILEKLQSEDPIVGAILDYRQLAKLKSTYADGLAAFIRADGRIHSRFQQMVTATGRLSSMDPNLQNIPVRMELGRKIRKAFVPAKGCCFVDADYSQIELRIMAHLSGDETLIAAYQGEADIHRLTASQVLHIPYNEVTPAQRSGAKAVNFGIIYGISSFGLGQDLNISRKEAEAYINRYFESYPKIKSYLDGLVTQAKETGYVTTLFGRRRPVPEIASSNYMQRSFGERIAMNSPVQGTAADIMKIAMNRVEDRLHREGLASKVVLQVHDELLVETPVEETEQVKRILVEEMAAAADLSVPLKVSVSVGANWYETK